MKTLKLTLLSIVAFAFFSCDKDEQREPSIVGKWEFSKISNSSTSGKNDMSDYPNIPGCSKDYFLFFSNNTSIEGKHEEECHQDTEAYKWRRNEGNFSLENRYGYDQYYVEFINENIIKLSGGTAAKPSTKSTAFYILERVRR